MAINPPANFTDFLYLDETYGEVHLNATLPIVWSQDTHTIAVQNAGAVSAGVITTGSQTIAGAKSFTSVPSCAIAPTLPEHLVNKGTVDDLVTLGVHWLANVDSFYEFATPPVSPADGVRYIAISSIAPFVANNIYTYEAATSDWIETVPVEGNALYVDNGALFADQCIIFNNAGAWVSLGSSINHQALIGAGTLTHSTIDMRLGQAVNTSSTPSFARISVTDALASTSTTTGALTCAGGLGVAGALFTGGAIRTTSTTASSSVSTGALISDGGLGVAGAAYINTLHVTDTTGSTGYTTGCATFAGGIGCAGDSYFTGKLYAARLGGFPQLYIQNAATESMQVYVGYDTTIGKACIYYNSVQADPEIRIGTGTTSSIYPTRVRFPNTTTSTSATTGAVVFDGGVGIAGVLFTGGAIRTTSTTASSSVSTGSLIANGGLGVAGAAYIGGLLRVTDTTASTTSVTGCATFAGGVGIAGALNVGGAFSCAGFSFTGPLVISDTTTSTSTTTGCARFAGGIGVAENAYINTLRVTSTTEADGTTGCATFAGGIGVALKGYFGGQLFASRLGTYAQLEIKNGVSGATSLKFHTGSPTYSTAGLACMYLTSDVTRNLFIGSHIDGTNMHTVTFANTAASTSSTTGAVIFAGGIGVGGAIYTGSHIISGGQLYASSTDDTTGLGVGSLQVLGGAYVQKRLIVASEEQSTSTSTGAIRASGGLAIAKNAYIGGLTRITDTTTSTSVSTGCATIAGGLGVAGNTYIGGLARITNTTASTTSITGCATFAGGVGVAGALNVAGAISSSSFDQTDDTGGWCDSLGTPDSSFTTKFARLFRICFLEMPASSHVMDATIGYIYWGNTLAFTVPAGMAPSSEVIRTIPLLINTSPVDGVIAIQTNGNIHIRRADSIDFQATHTIVTPITMVTYLL